MGVFVGGEVKEERDRELLDGAGGLWRKEQPQ